MATIASASTAPRAIAATEKRHAIDWRFLIHVCLHLAGFAAVTLLMIWGLFVLFFVAIGGFSIDGTMHQLHNLTARYVAADPVRLASFGQVVLGAHLLLAIILIALRRHTLLPARGLARSVSA